tara:strand:+ start:414 stop:974 length:561 start_codon:yes stop_codon:yes gene_type:complete
MINKFLLYNFFFVILSFSVEASIKKNIINKLKEVNNLTFEFEQNINEKIEKGSCIIEYPKKIYCTYKNKNKKILVSNGKNLVIKNQISNQFYIYPIEKTPLNLILDKNYLIEKMSIVKSDFVDKKFYRFKFEEGDNVVNIFFDKKSFNLIGWQNVDIYQNLVVTYMYNIQTNTKIKKGQFNLPTQN